MLKIFAKQAVYGPANIIKQYKYVKRFELDMKRNQSNQTASSYVRSNATTLRKLRWSCLWMSKRGNVFRSSS
jgi:hypothetical protein